MVFNKHSNLEGQHAFLSASKYHWINYDEEKLIQAYLNFLATQKGTRLHAYAAESISLGQNLPRSKKTLNAYVNDAIGFKMTPEQPLYFSDNCFGTADAIGFKNDLLRIHDLKTGVSPVSMSQLMVYAALFCMEYDKSPKDIHSELRIYQNDEILVCEPEFWQIEKIMDTIEAHDRTINRIREEEINV